MANLQYHHYKRQLPFTGHFIGSVDLVFGISFPFRSTHQHSPLEDWHCTSSYRPSSLHRGTNRFWESWNGDFWYLRWQDVTAPPEKQANEETDNSVKEQILYKELFLPWKRVRCISGLQHGTASSHFSLLSLVIRVRINKKNASSTRHALYFDFVSL